MTKRQQSKAPAASLPLIDKKPEAAVPQAQIGVFNPNVLQFPTHEELVAVLFCLTFKTDVFHGQDQQGNLVNEQGNVIIPAKVRQFFQLLPVAAAAGK